MIDRNARIVIVGAGMSGILTAIRLRQAGYHDITIYEKAADLGGTWRDNTYPGLSCDVPSHLYSYSFELNPEWSTVYASGDEIRAYFNRVVDKYGVRQFFRFESEVVAAAFSAGRWRLTLRDGVADDADIVIFATGVLHHPYVPEFEGLSTFVGRAFHSARWDHDVSLEGKRVGVVGTGSTAVQIVTAVANVARSLSLFQRTAQWVFPRPNRAYTEDEKAIFRSEGDALLQLHREMSAKFAARFSDAVIDANSEPMKLIEQICAAHLEEHVADPQLRAALTPSYRAGCKRLVMANGFYEALQTPNVELVTEAIDRVVPEGIRTGDGRVHELDVLVLATGFNAHQFMRPVAITGLGGVTLDDAWRESLLAYRSIAIPGFPNLFMILGPHSPVGNFSLIEVAELQMDYLLQLLEAAVERGADLIHPKMDATRRLEREMREASKKTIWVTGCRSWYLDEAGNPGTWPFTYGRFRRDMATPDLEDFELEAPGLFAVAK